MIKLAGSSGPSNLIVVGEDAPQVLNYLDRALRSNGHDVAFARDGDETLAYRGRSLKQEIGSCWTQGIHTHAGFVRQRRFEFECRLRGTDGEYRWIMDAGIPSYDAEGRLVGYIGRCVDVTEQSQSEAALRHSEERYRDLFENANDIVFTADMHGTITSINKAGERILGRLRSELLGTNISNLVSPEFRNTPAEMLASKLGGSGTATHSLDILTSDGRRRSLEVSTCLIFRAGRPTGIQGIARDVTERNLALHKIRETQERLEIVARATNDAVWDWDLAANQVWWNEGVCWLFGYGEREVESSADWWLERIHPEDREDITRSVRRLIDGEGCHWSAQYRFRRADSRFAHVYDRGYVLRDESGKAVRLIGAMMDISQQKALEEQLRQKNQEIERQYHQAQEASRLKSEFLANMSHELRTPLNSIIGFSELMHDEVTGPVTDDQKEYLGDVLNSGHHLLHLINDILDLAKIESGRMVFRWEPMDVPQLISEVTDVLYPLIAEKNMRVEVEVDPSLRSVVGDGPKYKQILYNYLSNALKFTPEHGCIHVRVFPEEHSAFRTEVEDNGIGISRQDLERLFVEFEQLDSGLNKRYAGTGLGLMLTKRIVEAQGGKLGVRSALGRGSVFFALLPCNPVEASTAGRIEAQVGLL